MENKHCIGCFKIIYITWLSLSKTILKFVIVNSLTNNEKKIAFTWAVNDNFFAIKATNTTSSCILMHLFVIRVRILQENTIYQNIYKNTFRHTRDVSTRGNNCCRLITSFIIISYESKNYIGAIGFPDIFLVRIISRKTSDTYGRDHEKVTNILSESDFFLWKELNSNLEHLGCQSVSFTTNHRHLSQPHLYVLNLLQNILMMNFYLLKLV